jgi:single-stranded-DNA-specific exonuclease
VDSLSLTGKQWHVQNDARQLSSRQSFTILDALVENRKIREWNTATLHSFGYPQEFFPDIPAAMERIQNAIRTKEKIAIFGDYDCDGITSTALMARFFHRRNIRPILRLPHRVREGYGLKTAIVQECIKEGVQLLITVDTGISAEAEIQMASEAGIDVIVIDHHHLPEVLPTATALLHPGLHRSFPSPPPSAAGVTWTLVSALEQAEGNMQWNGQEEDIALSCIGTIADLVELKGGNRTLVQRGIHALNTLETGPLALLKLQSGLLAGVTSRDIAFRIAPRLNAAGRMAEPEIALQALLGDHASLLRLDSLNTERQAVVSTLFQQVLTETISLQTPFISVCGPQYSPGICGLISGKLTEALGKPSIVAHRNGNMCSASLRSIPGYHIAEGLQKNKDLLLSYGGHAMAAGCTFAFAHYQRLCERMAEDVLCTIPPTSLVPSLSIDLCVHPSHLTVQLCNALSSLEPHGQGNPEPLFLLCDVAMHNTRTVGKEGAHLQAMVGDKKLIGFNFGRFLNTTSKLLDIACRISIDSWQGRKSVQLMVEDMRIALPQERAMNTSLCSEKTTHL